MPSKFNTWLRENPGLAFLYGCLIVSGAALLAVIIYAIVKAAQGSGGGDVPGKGKPEPLTLRDPRQFFALSSTDGSVGRDDAGNLIVGGAVEEKGIDTREEALQYPLRAPYVAGESKEDWTTIARRATDRFYASQSVPDQAIVVEGKGKVVRLDGDKLTAKLLVVRQGATLLVCGDNPVLEVEGVLIESGGLLQCGAADAPFTGSLFDVALRANPLGYAKSGVVASQYSYRWYCPGVEKVPQGDPVLFTDITGSQHHFSNHLGPKVFGVGFCGNLVLHGSVGAAAKVQYRGTWSARNKDTKEAWFDPEQHFLTHGDPMYDDSYASVWTHLNDGSGVKGATSIQLDPETRGQSLAHWTPGAKILITCVTQQYAATGDKPATLGTPMMWLDYDPEKDKANHDANLATVNALIATGGTVYGDEIGVEVATIQSVDAATGTITLARPLKFHHAWNEDTSSAGGAFRASIVRDGVSIEVDTRPHVALLSRNIRIHGILEDAPLSGGAFNHPSTAPESANPSDFNFSGPGGKVVPDFAKFAALDTYTSVYDAAYKYRDEGLALTDPNDPKWQEVRRSVRVGTGAANDPSQYANVEDIEAVGCWQLGSAGMKGANSILGAHSMFRNGSSTTLDGVELQRMGINGASGNIAQYALHYHLAGWTRAFDEYLAEGAARDATVVNCSIHQCPSRVVSLHGTNLVHLRNNVSFLTYGSAWFTEEGVERFNIFEHNLAVATMLLRWSDWDNPSKLIPFAAYDFNNASVFWLKHNQNACVRNVSACCPRPVVAYWPITQRIAGAHNMASVCVGDEARRLPSTAASWCASGGNSPGKYALGITGHHAPCWAPESYYRLGYTTAQGCPAQANDNISAYYAFSDNVAYSLLALLNTYISFYACVPHASVDGLPCAAKSRQAYPTTLDDAPLWIPASGLNSTVDEVVVGTYLQPGFAGSSLRSEALFNPYTEAEEVAFNGGNPGTCCTDISQCPGRSSGIVNDATACSRCVPCVFSSCLSFGMSPFVGQTGSSMWSKAQSSWGVNCCALKYGGAAGGIPGTAPPPEGSTSMVFAVGDGVKPFPFSYIVLHNHMTDGALDMYPVNTVFSGPKTFFGDDCLWREGEYVNIAAAADTKIYLADGIDHTVFPSTMWSGLGFTPAKNVILYDEGGDHYEVTPPGFNLVSQGAWTPDNTAKGPYLMDMKGPGGTGRLLRYDSSFTNYSQMLPFVQADPTRTAIPMDYAVGLFHTENQIAVGDKICSILASIITPTK